MSGAQARMLAAFVALLLLLGGLAIVIIGNETKTPREAALERTDEGSPGTAPGGSAAEGPSGGAGDAPAPASGVPEAGGASAVAAAGGPPRAGNYRFRSERSGTRGTGTSTTTFSDAREYGERYEHVSRSAGQAIVRQLVEDQTDDGVKSSGYAEYAWTSAANHLTRELQISSREEGGEPAEEERRDCNWEPDVPMLQFPLRPGHSWSWESSCQTRGDRAETSQTRQGKTDVTGQRELQVGGRTFVGWVLRTSETREVLTTFTVAGQSGAQQIRQHITWSSTEVYVPALGLVAHAEKEFKQENQGVGGRDEARGEGRETIQLLTPDPS